MDRISAANATFDSKFRDADDGTGLKATSWNAEWPNGVQEELVGGLIQKAGRVPAAGVYDQVFKSIIDLVYAIGDFIQSNNDAVTPPQRYTWQTWVEVPGVFLVGRDAGQPEFTPTGRTAGAKTVTLTVDQIPGHVHTPDDDGVGTGYGLLGISIPGQSTTQAAADAVNSGSEPNIVNAPKAMKSAGGGAAHPNLPPYRVVRTWCRTA